MRAGSSGVDGAQRPRADGAGAGEGGVRILAMSFLRRERTARGDVIRSSRGDGIIDVMSRRARQRGFSLLEVLMVMVLIAATGLLAAGAMTGGFDRLALRATVKEIASELRHARARAIATGTPQSFVIDPRAHTWQSAEDRGGEIPGKLGVHFTGAREVQPAEGIGAIVFFGDGASTGGRVQVSHRDAAWNVDVAWLTGEVRVHRGEVVR